METINMAKTSTAKKPNAWSWQSPRGKVYTKGAWPTKDEAEYAASFEGEGYTPVRVHIVPVK